MNHLFLIFNGNNGATYIVNTRAFRNITTSLKFYKARTFKAVLIKSVLTSLSCILGRFNSKRLKSIYEIEVFLNDLLKSEISFNLDKDSSVLISPTRDKVIVNHHNTYFQKFAVGKSFSNVKKEAEIYTLFENKPKHFQVSNFSEIELADKVCSFTLSNRNINTQKKGSDETNLLPALVEFFNYSKTNDVSVAAYLNELKKNKSLFALDFDSPPFNDIYTNYGSHTFPLGLVHRDFKPWNILHYQKPLFYDFEEATLNGPPLEDLFNFYIDPIIRYKSPQVVIEETLNEKSVSLYASYLKSLNIQMDYTPFLFIYLLQRIHFWNEVNEMETSNKYLALLNHLSRKN